jgi:hypothetical protein
MASSKEAFFKLGRWKNSRTVLRLTVFMNGGAPEIRQGVLTSVDEDEVLVAFVDDSTRELVLLDNLEGAVFALNGDLLEIGCRDGIRLVLERALVC